MECNSEYLAGIIYDVLEEMQPDLEAMSKAMECPPARWVLPDEGAEPHLELVN